MPQDLTPELASRYDLVGNTLVQKSVADVKNDSSVEIGDSKQVDFYPQAKFTKWRNEVNFSARLVDDGKGQLAFEKNIVKYVKTDIEAHFYNLDNSFEIELLLNSKPASNVFTWTIQSKGLNFYYQPPLTAQEIAAGDVRPDNIVGSYAVYTNRKNHNLSTGINYRHGKAFHIYRPKATDAKGGSTWCDLNIENGLMTVTVPQTFLDTAVYPVLVDPTIGYTTVGGTGSFLNTDDVYGVHATATEDGTVNSISIYFSTASGNFKGLLVDGSSKTIVTNGISPAGSYSSTAAWYTTTYSSSPSISNTVDYYICGIVDTVVTKMYYDTGSSPDNLYDSSNSYASPTDPTDGTTGNRLYSAYATYTTGGGDTNVSATLETLSLATYAATVQLNVNVSASYDSLSLTEYSANINAETNIQASYDTLIITAYQASLGQSTNISASYDSLTLTEYAADISLDINISASYDSLVITENASTITFDVNVVASYDSLTLTEYPADVNLNVNISAGYDSLILTENASTITYDVNVLASYDTLVITTNAATISISAAPDADSLQFTLKASLCHFTLDESRAHYIMGTNRMHYYIGVDDNVLITPDYLIDIGDGTYLLANGADYLIQQ